MPEYPDDISSVDLVSRDVLSVSAGDWLQAHRARPAASPPGYFGFLRGPLHADDRADYGKANYARDYDLQHWSTLAAQPSLGYQPRFLLAAKQPRK